MANNTRLGLTNLLLLSGVSIKNGSGGGAPALEELSPYLMSNLLKADRYTAWQTSVSPPSPTQIDFDLGANKTVTAGGVLGFRRASSSIVASPLKIYSAASASGYVPGVWTLQATITVTSLTDFRDFGALINSVSHRYWRFEFGVTTGQFSVGKFWLGAPTDLGAIHSPGGLYAPFRNRLETPMPGGAVVLSDLGDPGAEWTLPWQTITSSLRTTLLSLQRQTASFLMIDPEDNFFEVYVAGGRVDTIRQFTTTFDANVALRRMP